MTIGEREYERHRRTTPNGKLAESYFDLAGVRGPVCEVIDAMAEDNDRLRRELEAVQRMIAELRNENVWVARHEQLSHENAILLESRTVAQEEVGPLNRELEAARDELARLRPVLEAASEFDEWCGDERCASGTCRIARAMNEYRAGAGKGGE